MEHEPVASTPLDRTVALEPIGACDRYLGAPVELGHTACAREGALSAGTIPVNAPRPVAASVEARPPVYGIVAIDLDGTLLPGATILEALAAELGTGDQVARLELDFAAGTISNTEIADLTAASLRGVSLSVVKRALSTVSWLPGIAQSIELLQGAGCTVLLATVTWEFAAEIVGRQFGFDYWCGTRMGHLRGDLTGEVESYFSAADKAVFARQLCVRLGISLSRLVAVGDSRSDIELFGVAGLAMAVNATPAAISAADVSLTIRDLRDIVPFVVDYLDALPGA